MNHVITLVGTSLITNYIAEDKDRALPIKKQYERYKDQPASEYDINKPDIERMQKTLSTFVTTSPKLTAEIKSLHKLHENLKENFDVYLLASDTLNSRICAEVIRDKVVLDGVNIHFNKHKHIIQGLQVTDRDRFAKEGLENLFSVIEGISGSYYKYTIINITGGYKATIPLLTIFAQVNHIPLYYIFEDTDAPIQIPSLPVTLDWDIFETYASIFAKAEHHDWGIDNWSAVEHTIQQDHRESFLTCFEIAGNYAIVNTAGKILWRRFKSRQYTFYSNEQVKQMCQNDPDFQQYLMKLFDEQLAMTKTEHKNGHLVLDLGRTAPRIFYRKKAGDLYVYKYTRHNNEYERFLEENPFSTLEDYGPYELITMKK